MLLLGLLSCLVPLGAVTISAAERRAWLMWLHGCTNLAHVAALGTACRREGLAMELATNDLAERAHMRLLYAQPGAEAEQASSDVAAVQQLAAAWKLLEDAADLTEARLDSVKRSFAATTQQEVRSRGYCFRCHTRGKPLLITC
jgi:hypothetical protein